MIIFILLLSLIFVGTLVTNAHAFRKSANFDENNVAPYVLPTVLHSERHGRIVDAQRWRSVRRPEIIDLFSRYVYGYTPTDTVKMTWRVVEQGDDALNGCALRKQIRLTLATDHHQHGMDVLLYVPRHRRPAPVVLGLNFLGNHAVHADNAIRLPASWMRASDDVKHHRATEKGRGKDASRWPVEYIIEQGYALATVYYGDITPDFDGGFRNGVHALFASSAESTSRRSDHWGAIGAWAWGLSRMLDYLFYDEDVDAHRNVVMGHSRLGKTALWAAAQDERFRIVVSNNSGCGGASLSRRRFGETVFAITSRFPHWFCPRFRTFAEKEGELPVDQHMLIAALAPRPVYIASAEEDLWADPKGEFLSALEANPVYALFGTSGLPDEHMPPINTPVGDTIRYHIRTGKHTVTKYDWKQFLHFADEHV